MSKEKNGMLVPDPEWPIEDATWDTSWREEEESS